MTFRFSITDMSIFLNKSPVTIRAWDRKGFVQLPRIGGNRSLSIDELWDVAETAKNAGRITPERHTLIREALISLRYVERENQ